MTKGQKEALHGREVLANLGLVDDEVASAPRKNPTRSCEAAELSGFRAVHSESLDLGFRV